MFRPTFVYVKIYIKLNNYITKNRTSIFKETYAHTCNLHSGTLAAHEKFFLVLLRSRPDTIRRFPLRETQASLQAAT